MSLSNRLMYLSHKRLRWFGGLFLGAFVASVLSAAYLWSVWLGCGATALAAGYVVLCRRSPSRRWAIPWEIAVAMLATLYGVALAMRGKTVVTWAPAASRD